MRVRQVAIYNRDGNECIIREVTDAQYDRLMDRAEQRGFRVEQLRDRDL